MAITTVTIGKNAGNAGFDVPKLDLNDFLSKDMLKHDLVLGEGDAPDTLQFAEKGSGNTVTFTGQFDLKAIRKDDLVKSVQEINQISWTQNNQLAYTISDLTLTGADIADQDAFKAFLDALQFKLVGNDKNNDLTGGLGDDELLGGGGSDRLDGSKGADRLVGGEGDDFYRIDGDDKVVEDKGPKGGIDTIIADGTVNLGKFANVENVGLLGDGKADAIGTDEANRLEGNAGDNTLDGGKGIDRLIGGDGDDTYIVDNAKDIVVEDGKSSDHDVVKASVSYDISGNDGIEDIVLTGNGDIDAIGNDGDNSLIGNGGKNTLDGGKGADRMEGGAGDDTYFVDNKKDVVIEKGPAGDHDQINASIGVDLSKLAGIEDVFLFGKSNVGVTGNAGNNTISGNVGDNELTGNGGADTFEFHAGGHEDVVTDFNAKKGAEHDLIDLSDFGGKPLKFANLDIDKIGKTAVEINFGKGDSLHLDLVGSTVKDIDASDFIF